MFDISISVRLFRVSFLSVLALALAFSSSSAARESTTSFTCEQVKQLVSQRGAVVLNTNNSSVISIYGRFVANRTHCKFNQRVVRHNVPTKSSSCRLNLCVDENDN